MRIHRSLFVFALLLVVGVMAGCQAAAPFDPPEVSVVDVRFTEATLLETSAVVTVRLANGNPDPIAVDGGSYDLTLSGTRIGRGLSAERVEVPRYESATTEVVFHVSNLRLFTKLNGLMTSGNVSYRLSGKINVEHPEGRYRMRVAQDGAVDLSGAGSDR